MYNYSTHIGLFHAYHPSAFFGHADYTQPMWREMKRNEVKTILVLAIVVAILAITSAVGDLM